MVEWLQQKISSYSWVSQLKWSLGWQYSPTSPLEPGNILRWSVGWLGGGGGERERESKDDFHWGVSIPRHVIIAKNHKEEFQAEKVLKLHSVSTNKLSLIFKKST